MKKYIFFTVHLLALTNITFASDPPALSGAEERTRSSIVKSFKTFDHKSDPTLPPKGKRFFFALENRDLADINAIKGTDDTARKRLLSIVKDTVDMRISYYEGVLSYLHQAGISFEKKVELLRDSSITKFVGWGSKNKLIRQYQILVIRNVVFERLHRWKTLQLLLHKGIPIKELIFEAHCALARTNTLLEASISIKDGDKIIVDDAFYLTRIEFCFKRPAFLEPWGAARPNFPKIELTRKTLSERVYFSLFKVIDSYCPRVGKNIEAILENERSLKTKPRLFNTTEKSVTEALNANIARLLYSTAKTAPKAPVKTASYTPSKPKKKSRPQKKKGWKKRNKRKQGKNNFGQQRRPRPTAPTAPLPTPTLPAAKPKPAVKPTLPPSEPVAPPPVPVRLEPLPAPKATTPSVEETDEVDLIDYSIFGRIVELERQIKQTVNRTNKARLRTIKEEYIAAMRRDFAPKPDEPKLMLEQSVLDGLKYLHDTMWAPKSVWHSLSWSGITKELAKGGWGVDNTSSQGSSCGFTPPPHLGEVFPYLGKFPISVHRAHSVSANIPSYCMYFWRKGFAALGLDKASIAGILKHTRPMDGK